MSGSDRPSTAKLDSDDLELLIEAIESLSTKIDAIEKNAPVFSPDQAIRLSTAFAAKAENTAQQNLAPVLSQICLLYTSPSPRDRQKSRMPSSA